jgi:hypothetical protein
MSDNGHSPLPEAPAPSGPIAPPPSSAKLETTARRRWFQYLGPAIFALFCIEVGVLLVLAPWMEIYERNVFQFIPLSWQPVLLSHHFRGALSALGFLNFLIALNELIDLVRPPRGKR